MTSSRLTPVSLSSGGTGGGCAAVSGGRFPCCSSSCCRRLSFTETKVFLLILLSPVPSTDVVSMEKTSILRSTRVVVNTAQSWKRWHIQVEHIVALWCHMQHRSGSTWAHVMAWCLSAPSHYLNQCCLPFVRFRGIPLKAISGLILGLQPANERRRYFVMASPIGWAQL